MPGLFSLPRRPRRALIFLLVSFFLAVWSLPAVALGRTQGNGGNNAEAYRIFWFLLIADTHFGAEEKKIAPYPQALTNFHWLLEQAFPVVRPLFVVNLGDLTDQHPYNISREATNDLEQWQRYQEIVADSGLAQWIDGLPRYLDPPGNHDQYHEDRQGALSNYLDYSVLGQATGATEYAWLYRPLWQGRYLFITTDTPDPEMTNPAMDALGTNKELVCQGELDRQELSFFRKALIKHPRRDLSFAFGHHGLEGWGAIKQGNNAFASLLARHHVGLYAYGHTHAVDHVDPYFPNPDTLVYNVNSLAQDGEFALVAVDNDGIAVQRDNLQVDSWPIVLMTTPLDRSLGGINPHAADLPLAPDNPVRALVFADPGLCALTTVSLLVDWAFQGELHRISANPKDPLHDAWETLWDTANLSPGEHELTVTAACEPVSSQYPAATKTGSHTITVRLSDAAPEESR